jgi:hypothetical protein
MQLDVDDRFSLLEAVSVEHGVVVHAGFSDVFAVDEQTVFDEAGFG